MSWKGVYSDGNYWPDERFVDGYSVSAYSTANYWRCGSGYGMWRAGVNSFRLPPVSDVFDLSPFEFVEGDHFDNATLDFTTQVNESHLSESGTVLTLTVPTDYEWALFFDNNAPRAGYTVSSYSGKAHCYEIKMNGVTASETPGSEFYSGFTNNPGSGNPRHYAIGPYSGNGTDYIILLLRRSSGSQTILDTSVSIPSPDEVQYYRMYWNDTGGNITLPEADEFELADNNVAFYYSLDGGDTFTKLYNEANSVGADLNTWGVFGWDQFPRHNGAGGGTATYDWIRRYEYTP